MSPRPPSLVAALVLAAPLGAAQELTPSSSFTNPAASSPDRFGTSLAMDAERAAVGRLQDFSTGLPTGLGFVDVYVRAGTTWTLEDTLTVDEELPGDRVAEAIALDGDVLAVGAPGRDDAGDAAGAVYVFEHDGASWSQKAKLVAPDARSWEQFGHALDVDGDRIVVGTNYGQGGAYVFARGGTTWAFEQQLAPTSDDGPSSNFGAAVAILDDRIIVGAPGFDGASYDSGAAYVFELGGGTWSEATRLESSDLTVLTEFGRAVDLADDRLLVGAATGRAYVFDALPGGAWSDERVLEPCEPVGSYTFGMDVAWADGRALVPAVDEASVYVFAAVDDAWGVSARLTPGAPSSGDEFGAAVAGLADELWVGAPGAANELGEVARFDAVEVDPWTDLCGALAGATTPRLDASGALTPAAPTTLAIGDAPPLGVALLVVGLTALDAPFKGGLLVPRPDLLVGLPTDASGAALLSTPWPAGVPSGTDLWLQAWIADATGPIGFTSTNAVTATVD